MTAAPIAASTSALSRPRGETHASRGTGVELAVRRVQEDALRPVITTPPSASSASRSRSRCRAGPGDDRGLPTQ